MSNKDKEKEKKIKKPRRKRTTDKNIIKKRKQIKLYFNEDTQAAIENFQATDSISEKDKIYTAEIMPAFEKLAENLIFIHKFTSLHESFDDLKNNCVTFLYETLYKFDASRGSKAFSYFNVVAKNYLIIKANQKTKFSRKNISIENKRAFSKEEMSIFQNSDILESPDTAMIKKAESALIFDMIKYLEHEVKSANEKACIAAIKELFENAHDLPFLNKRAVFVYLREISGLSPKQLTTTISNLKKKYRALKENDEFRVFFE